MTLVNTTQKMIADFAQEEDGAQIVEYGLIIAAVSLALIVALSALAGGDFTTFTGNVGTWLKTGKAPA
jgi:pilus assembly protein Flp/PilA